MTRAESNIVLFSITLCWASSYIFIKNLPDSLSPFAYLTMTAGLASIILALVFFKRLRELNQKLLLRSAIMASLIGANLVCERIGLQQLPASTTSFIASLNIVIVPILLLFMKRKPTRNNLVGIVLIVTGLVFTCGISLGGPVNSGVWYVTAGCVFMAFFIIVTDRFTKQYNPLLLGIGQMFFTAAFSLVLWFIEDPLTFLTINYTNQLLANIFLLAFFAKAYAYIMLMYSQKYANPISVTVIASTEPVITMVLAILIPASFATTETFSFVKLIGALFIVAGAICAGTNFLERKEASLLERDTISV